MAAVEDDSSDLSSLSSLSPIPSDVELDDLSDDAPTGTKSGILKFFPKLAEQPPKEPSPPPRKRSPSPPHEYVLADNPDVAVSFLSFASSFFRPSMLAGSAWRQVAFTVSTDAKFRVQTSLGSTNSYSSWSCFEAALATHSQNPLHISDHKNWNETLSSPYPAIERNIFCAPSSDFS